MIETLGDVRKGVVLFYRLSDLLTYLKFQYSKVIHVTSFFILKSFRYLLVNASQEHFVVSGVYYDIYTLSLSSLDYFKT